MRLASASGGSTFWVRFARFRPRGGSWNNLPSGSATIFERIKRMAGTAWWSQGLGTVALVGLAVAIGCSSNSGNSLTGQVGGEPIDDAGQPCPSGTSASDGQGYVQNRGCPTCHTADMGGTTTPLAQYSANNASLPADLRVYLYPPNLTPDPTTGVGKWRDSDLSLAITEGIDNQSERLCPQMQHYPGMCANEVTGIIAYLRSIPAVVRAIPRSICPPLKDGTPPGGDDGGGD
jgi:hypothetical protein